MTLLHQRPQIFLIFILETTIAFSCSATIIFTELMRSLPILLLQRLELVRSLHQKFLILNLLPYISLIHY